MTDDLADDIWLPRYAARPKAKLSLFCFPHAGAGLSIFSRWPAALPDFIELCPVQLPGRETRLQETPVNNGAVLASEIADRMARRIDRPYALFGHSMGAQLAFQVARELRQRGGPSPRHLFVSARPAPQLPHARAPIHGLPQAAFLSELKRIYNPSVDAWIVPELMEIMLPVIRADIAVCETYAYTTEPPLSCSIDAFGGDRDLSATRDSLEAWREQTMVEFKMKIYPGGHFYIEGALPDVLDRMVRALSRYLPGSVS